MESESRLLRKLCFYAVDSTEPIFGKTVCPHAARWLALQCFVRGLFVRPSRSTAGGRGMGDNTEMGRLAVTEELHAKQQEATRKESRARGQEGAAGRGCGCEG